VKYISRFFGIVLCLCLLAGLAWSQTLTGKVAGRVADANGKPLPGVNVVVQGMKLGAVSDADGYYVILSIDPGIYELKASIIGYEAVRERNVQVVSGRTTTKNFALKETAVAGSEVVVQAQRPLVEVDRTSSESKISAKEIEQVPILRTAKEHLQFVAGVGTGRTDSPGNGVRIRRMNYFSMDASQTWTLDGMELANMDQAVHGWAFSQYNNVPVTSIGEVGVVKGGANASQVSSPAGVVNIVTREGTRALHGGLDFRAEPPGKRHFGPNVYDAVPGQKGGTNGLWRDRLKWNDATWVAETDPVTGKQVHVKQDYESAVGHLMEGWVTGPLGQNATFVLSGKTSQAKEIFPAPRKTGPRQWSIFGKLTYTPSENIRLKFGYNQSNEPRYWSGSSDIRGSNANLFLIRGFTGYEQQWRNRIVYLTTTHTLSPKTFQEFQVGFFGTKTDTTENVDRTTDASFRRDKSGFFNLDRQRRRIVFDDNRRYNFRYDFTSQVTRRNLLRTGITHQVFHSTNWDYDRQSPTRAVFKIVSKDSKPDQRYVVQRFAGYVDEKLEFEGMVVNAGLRFDALWGGPRRALSGSLKALPGYTTYTAFQTRLPLAQSRPMYSWSPRIGLSHPITARSVVRYSYGVYYKPPDFSLMWQEPWVNKDAANHPNLDATWTDDAQQGGGVWRLDSGYHNPGGLPNTAEFEVTGEWNFVSDFVFELSTYFRRTERVGSQNVRKFIDPVKTLPLVLGRGANARLESKGIEAGFSKGLSRNFSFRASVDVGWTLFNWSSGSPLSVDTYPDSTYIAGPNYFFVDAKDNVVRLTDAEIRHVGNRANEAIRKLQRGEYQEFVGAWGTNRIYPLKPWSEFPGLSDEEKSKMQGLWYQEVWRQVDAYNTQPPTTQASFQFLWSTPPGWGPGPTVGGSKLLGGIQANLVWRFDSGTPFAFTPPGTKTENVRNGPIFVRTDLNFQKTFEGGRVRPTIYAEVFNLFNSYVDGTRGDAYARWGLKRPAPNDANYLRYGDPSPFRGDVPRYVNVGVRVGF